MRQLSRAFLGDATDGSGDGGYYIDTSTIPYDQSAVDAAYNATDYGLGSQGYTFQNDGSFNSPASTDGSSGGLFGFLQSIIPQVGSWFGQSTGTAAPAAPGSYGDVNPAAPAGTAPAAAPATDPTASTGIVAWAQANPMLAIGGAGLIAFLIAKAAK